jgi:hypothetical protein
MVARLKLKGIDGRAPPGVNRFCPAAATLLRSDPKGKVVTRTLVGPRRTRVGDMPKLRGSPKALGTKPTCPKGVGGRVNRSGKVTTSGMSTMGDPQPSPVCPGEGSETRWVWVGAGPA